MTARAVQTLREVAFVVCEDTRHSGLLLDHSAIHATLVSLPAFAEKERRRILDRLGRGGRRAGHRRGHARGSATPARRWWRGSGRAAIQVVPIPGPSARDRRALSASGCPPGAFTSSASCRVRVQDRTGDARRGGAPPRRRWCSTSRRGGSGRRCTSSRRRSAPPRRRGPGADQGARGVRPGTLPDLAARYRDEPPLGEVVRAGRGPDRSRAVDRGRGPDRARGGLARGERARVALHRVARQAGSTAPRCTAWSRRTR